MTTDDFTIFRDRLDLHLLLAAGVITQLHFDRAWAILNSATGVPCDRCGRGPAQIGRGTVNYCGRCFLETA